MQPDKADLQVQLHTSLIIHSKVPRGRPRLSKGRSRGLGQPAGPQKGQAQGLVPLPAHKLVSGHMWLRCLNACKHLGCVRRDALFPC